MEPLPAAPGAPSTTSEGGPASASETVYANLPDGMGNLDDEVNMVDDLAVDPSQDIELGDEDRPPDDEQSELGSEMGFDDDRSELGDDAPSLQPVMEPPVEDHSMHQLRVHTEPVFSVAINGARPEQVATGGGDDTAYLWRLDAPDAPAYRLDGHTDTVSCMQFNADGSLLATGGLEGTVRVWNAETGVLVVALEGPSQGVNWLAWHNRGNVLLAGSEDSTSWMWKLPDGSVMQIFSAHSASVSYGVFANNGRSVVTASEDGSVRVWNPRTGTVDHCLYCGAHGAREEGLMITCLAAHAAHPVIMFGMDDGKLKLAQVESGKVLAQLSAHEASVESAGFCDCMQLAATCGMDGRLCVWDLNTFGLRHVCQHGAGVVELRWMRDSALLVTCTVSRELRVYDARDGSCARRMIGHHDAVLCVALGYTPNGAYVLSGSDDCTARVWNLSEQPQASPTAVVAASAP